MINVAKTVAHWDGWGWLQRTARYWLVEVDTTSAEFIASLEAIVLGLFLLSPLATFASSPTFSVAERIAPEETWGMLLWVAGIVQLGGVIMQSEKIRSWLSLITACIWGVFAASLIAGNPSSSSTVTYPLFALAMLWAHINLEVR